MPLPSQQYLRPEDRAKANAETEQNIRHDLDDFKHGILKLNSKDIINIIKNAYE
jgi:hypothetical protein